MAKMSTKKYREKLEIQARTNPGHKTAYEQPLRPRSAVFNTKKQYNRQQVRLDFQRAIAEY